MKRFVMLIVLLGGQIVGAAIPAAVWEISAEVGAAQTNGGGFVWQSICNNPTTVVTWTKTTSDGGTRNEYYCLKGAGACTGTKPLSVTIGGNFIVASEGNIAAGLNAGEWDWGDIDSLGFDTVYVKLTGNVDPDTMNPAYVAMSTGTDHSQTAAPHITAADITVVDGDTTQVYRAGATKFAVDDSNNILCIAAGGGLTAGRYHIMSVDPNNDLHLDASVGAADAAVSTGYVGGKFLLGGGLDDDWTEVLAAGSSVYWKAGAYTLGEAVSTTNDGTSPLPIKWYGYNTTRGDAPAAGSANQPVLTINSNNWVQGDYNWWSYIAWKGTSGSTPMMQTGTGGLIYDCNGLDTSVTASRICVQAGIGARIIKCLLKSTNGIAIQAALNTNIDACVLYSSSVSAVTSVDRCSVTNCLILGNGIGLNIDTGYRNIIRGNIINGNTTGISANNGYSNYIVSNIITNNTTGANWTTATPDNFWANNCWYGNGTARTNVAEGLNELASDPLFVDATGTWPGQVDFSLQAGSPCLAAGMGLTTSQDLAATFKINIGPDWDNNAPGGRSAGANLNGELQ